MKTCPTCRRSYAEASTFCPADGAILQGVEALAARLDAQQAQEAPQPAAAPPVTGLSIRKPSDNGDLPTVIGPVPASPLVAPTPAPTEEGAARPLPPPLPVPRSPSSSSHPVRPAGDAAPGAKSEGAEAALRPTGLQVRSSQSAIAVPARTVAGNPPSPLAASPAAARPRPPSGATAPAPAAAPGRPAGSPPPLPTGQQPAAAQAVSSSAVGRKTAPSALLDADSATGKPTLGQLAAAVHAAKPAANSPEAYGLDLEGPIRPKEKPKPVANDAGEGPTLLTSMETGDSPLDSDDAPYIGTLIADRYLIVSLIGRGGMGAVYRAEQIHLRKTMAVKLLHESLSARKQLISRFTREARAISRLSCPHTVMVYDFGRWGELFYLVMELLEGDALDQVLDRDGPLPAERVAKITLQMCDSLAEAHRSGIIHRDLKPENVMLVTNQSHPDFVKILDFGLAKVQGVDDPYTIHSQRDIFGTPYYMSPEQIRAGDIDGRSDIYAVGALMFRMLTGKYLFADRSTFDILKAHLMEAPPRLAEVRPDLQFPVGLEQIVAKALAKEPAGRFASMEELAHALSDALQRKFAYSPTLPLPKGSAAPSAGALEEPTGKLAAAQTGATAAVSPQLVNNSASSKPATGPHEPAESDEVIERRERRSKGLRIFGFLLLFVLLGAVMMGTLWFNQPPPGGREYEPNDTPGQANPLSPDGKSRGMIGKRASAQKADIDCFRLPELKDSDDLSIKIQGVPNMDLQVSLVDGRGVTVLQQTHRGRGEGELLRHAAPADKPTTVCITEFLPAGAVAGESLSDEYTLEVEVKPREGEVEREPNDGRDKDVQELANHTPLTGTLDGPQDRDVYQLQGNFDGRIVQVTLELRGVQGPSGVRLALIDNGRRTLASQILRKGELRAVLAFVANVRQMPDRLVIERVPGKDGSPLTPGEIDYTVTYADTALTDQPEQEPNNTEDSATPLVLGAWHLGTADDAAGIDWLRVDGGDPTMSRIHVEAVSPGQNTYWLTVRDQGTQVDLRKVLIQPGLDGQTMDVDGSGQGFLISVTPAEASRKNRGTDAHYQIRARYVPVEERK